MTDGRWSGLQRLRLDGTLRVRLGAIRRGRGDLPLQGGDGNEGVMIVHSSITQVAFQGMRPL